MSDQSEPDDLDYIVGEYVSKKQYDQLLAQANALAEALGRIENSPWSYSEIADAMRLIASNALKQWQTWRDGK